MKRTSSILLAMILIFSLTGCGSKAALDAITNRGEESTKESSDSDKTEEESTDSSNILDDLKSDTNTDEDTNTQSNSGYEEGRMGDTMHTYFFDYTVDSAYTCSEFEGFTPDEGNKLLVAEVTVKNTHHESIEMYDTDFQAQWGDDDNDDAWEVPITYDGSETGLDPLNDDQFPGIYELTVNESKTGLLIFQVPAEEKDFSVSYMEAFDDDSTGVTYFVYFTAQEQ